MYRLEGAGVMYPELAKVGNDLREIRTNLTFILLEIERHSVMPKV